MGFLNPAQDDQARIDAMPGTTDVPLASGFDGLASAAPKGVVGGLAKVGQLANDLGQSYVENYAALPDGFRASLDLGHERERYAAATKVASDWAATGQDPRETGQAGRIVAGTAEGVTIATAGAAVAGPWGAAGLLGSTEGYSTYLQGKADGLDDTTAKEQAGLTGLFAAGSAFLPMKFGKSLATSVFGGAAANVGLGMAQRGLTSEVLQANGYHDMAKQYRVFDGEAMAADTILGSAFGAMGHFMHPAEGKAPDVNPADVDAAVAVASEDHFNRSAPGVPIDAATATLHADTMAGALHDLANGDLPTIEPERAQQLVDNVIPDPMHSWASALPPGVVRAYHGTASVFGDKYSTGEGIGPHFGTVEQASKFAVGEGGHIRPVDLHFTNTLRLPDGGWENPSMLLLKLEREGVISEDEMLPTVPFRGRVATPDEQAADVAAVRKLIQSKGYDSVVYRNEHEGEGDSYIALDPDKQVKSATAPNALQQAAHEDLPGYAAAAADVPRMELPPEQMPPPKPEPAPLAEGETPPVPLDDFHGEMLDHLVHNYGDAPYTTEDGRQTTYRQMAAEMQAQRNEADHFAKLHDIAAACAARNGA